MFILHAQLWRIFQVLTFDYYWSPLLICNRADGFDQPNIRIILHEHKRRLILCKIGILLFDSLVEYFIYYDGSV